MKTLRLLVGCLEGTGIARFEIQNAQMQLSILMEPGATSRKVLAEADGIFLDAHPLLSTPFVRPGDPVGAGQVLGLLKIGALYRPVVAQRGGVVRRVLAESGDAVKCRSPLFELTPP